MAIIPADEKVFMASNGTNTTYGGSAALQAMQQWYTMEDVTNTVRPYKVFTALLTQSGGDSESYVYIGGLATIGVTYTITANDDDLADFTNIGAPNNNIGTKFIATGTTPASWGDYAELTYNLGAPVATVLENTIGNVWFTYLQTGFYQANYDGLFTLNKTFGQGTTRTADDGTGFGVISVIPNNINTVNIYSTNPIVELPFDNILFNTPIEIRVYN